MTRKLITLITAGMLAFSGAALSACGSNDRPESEDIERGAEDAGNAAEDAANGAAGAVEDATDEEK